MVERLESLQETQQDNTETQRAMALNVAQSESHG